MPIAKALDRPGDAIPAILKKFFTSFDSSIMKSSLSLFALIPAKFLMFSEKSKVLIVLYAFLLTKSSEEEVVDVSIFSTTFASGPTITFPSTVILTNTPFPSLSGHWKIV